MRPPAFGELQRVVQQVREDAQDAIQVDVDQRQFAERLHHQLQPCLREQGLGRLRGLGHQLGGVQPARNSASCRPAPAAEMASRSSTRPDMARAISPIAAALAAKSSRAGKRAAPCRSSARPRRSMIALSGLLRSCATTARMCSRSRTAARNCSCVWCSAVTSSLTATAPVISPASLRIGAAQLMMVLSEPSKHLMRISSLREVSPRRTARAIPHSSAAIGSPVSSHQPS